MRLPPPREQESKFKIIFPILLCLFFATSFVVLYVAWMAEASDCELRGGELVRPAAGFGFMCAKVLP